MRDLVTKMAYRIKSSPGDIEVYEDLFQLCRAEEETHEKYCHEVNSWLRNRCIERVEYGVESERFYDLYRRSLLFDAPYALDPYLLYLEINRPPEARFYLPRRRTLKPVVDAIQSLIDDDLDELFLSMPPRVGKTSLIDFTMTYIMAKRSESPSLYSAYSDTITSAFYGAVLEIITDNNTYTWQEIFPKSKLIRTNAADETIDIDRRKHYPTLTCRSIDGTLNGACDAQNGFIIGDDLVSGIEEALSKDRLISKWNKVDNNLIPRGKGRTKYLWIGTRWSVLDPIGMRLDVIQNEDKFSDYRWKVINIPALDEHDESNFDYPYGVGFSTIDYQRRRASFERNNDMASWNAQYMGMPIEREGTLYSPADFRYFSGDLPEEEPDRIFMPIDPAFGGEDFVAGPVCYQYGDDIYIPDVIYNNGDKKITQPRIVELVDKWDIQIIDFEETKSTASYREETTNLLKSKDLKPTVTSHTAPNDKSKQQRIFDSAPDVREHMIFLNSGHRSKEYEMFMNNVFAFRLLQSKSAMHHRHDDAPDSLAMAIKMTKPTNRKLKSFRRPF